ncbi:microfibrillar-associated protein 1 [Macrobrachium rosenbergii]|uniref:microfibrillar-associated protein 1 n=1 Tax=Macrobrachium rosenbergii TaxID=79674 RepID=UPI0034D59B5A
MESINASWTAPPGAAQPMGIQSTAGAVPVMNDKGEVSMKKVKVQRYVSGKRPDYAPASSDDEEEEDEDFTVPRGAVPTASAPHKSLTEAEMADPRLRRLLAHREVAVVRDEEEMDHDIPSRRRLVHETEVVELSDGEEPESPSDREVKDNLEGDIGEIATPDEETMKIKEEKEDTDEDERMESKEDVEMSEVVEHPTLPPEVRRSHRLAESDSESEGEVDENELVIRRLNIRQRALQKIQQEEEILGKEDEGSEESSEEESSEYSEESDSEEEGPRLKPVFVRKKDRVTIHQKEQQQVKVKQQEADNRRRVEERRRETLRLIEQENRNAANLRNNIADNDPMNTINTDDEADDAEYELWKLRELRRLKRDKEEREAAEKDHEEVDKLRNMTEEERRIELRNNPKVITNKAIKGKYKFLQKYYHRGSFFLDNEEEVLKRDFSGATLEDHFDKTILPKVMQVKNFGRSGRTKYTHLVDQDTTSFDSPWASDTQMNHKFFNSNAGGMKQLFDRIALKKRTGTSANNTTARK